MFLPIGKNAPARMPTVELNSSASRGRRVRRGYTVIRILGEGAFGLVKLVQSKETKVVFAMKVIEKWSVLESKYLDPFAEDYVRNELKVGILIREVNSPFLAKLCAAFQTEDKLYYLLDYYPGGDLFGVIESQYPNGLPPLCAIHYLSEILSGLGALHSLGVLHRDLRMENVLIDASSHARLCDYGLALLLTDESDRPFIERRTTEMCCGVNKIFQSPETETESGYGPGLDFWQLGIMAYAMCTGEFPPECSGEPEQRREEIATQLQGLSFRPLATFVQQLLEEREEPRLGYNGGAAEVSQHAVFCDTNWNDILACKVNTHLFKPRSSEIVVQKLLRDSVPACSQDDVLSFPNFTFRADSMDLSRDSSINTHSAKDSAVDSDRFVRFSSNSADKSESTPDSTASCHRSTKSMSVISRTSLRTSRKELGRISEQDVYISARVSKFDTTMLESDNENEEDENNEENYGMISIDMSSIFSKTAMQS